MNKEEIIKGAEAMLNKMYYEEAEFFYNMMCRFMEKTKRG